MDNGGLLFKTVKASVTTRYSSDFQISEVPEWSINGNTASFGTTNKIYFTVFGGYTLRLGNNMTAPETATAFEYGNYTVEYSSEGYELAGKKIQSDTLSRAMCCLN